MPRNVVEEATSSLNLTDSTLCSSTARTGKDALHMDKDAITTESRPVARPSSTTEGEEPFQASPALKLAIASLCCVSLAAALDATSLSIALSTITSRIHGTAVESFWAGTGYLLTCGVFQPVIGGLSHVFGRKEVRI